MLERNLSHEHLGTYLRRAGWTHEPAHEFDSQWLIWSHGVDACVQTWKGMTAASIMAQIRAIASCEAREPAAVMQDLDAI